MVDTLSQYYSLPSADSLAHWGQAAASPAELFGPISSFSGEVVTDVVAINNGLALNISWENGTAMLILLMLFCFAVYRFANVARASFKAVFSTSDARSLFESSTVEFTRYIRYGFVMFMLSVAIMVDGMTDDVGGDFLQIVGLFFVMIVASLISGAVVRLVGYFDHNAARWAELRAIRKLDRTVGAYFFAVPVIIFSYSSSMHIVLWIMVCVAIGIYFFRLLLFFIRRGFSFLQWILYLCAVEIAPFALLWGIASRLNSIHP